MIVSFFGVLQLHLPERRFAAHQGNKIYCLSFRFVSSLTANEVICGKYVRTEISIWPARVFDAPHKMDELAIFITQIRFRSS